MTTQDKKFKTVDWIRWIELITKILSFVVALITLHVTIKSQEQFCFAMVVLGFLVLLCILIVIIVYLIKKSKFSSISKFWIWLKSLFNKIKWIASASLFFISFSIFITPLLLRPSAYTIFDDSLRNYWTIDVLGERAGVSWDIIDLDSSNKALLITFSNYQANQEVILAALGTPLNGVDLNKYFRLKGETIRLRVKARSLNNDMSFKVRIGGGNNNSITFQRSNMINLTPATVIEFVLPKEEDRAISAEELKHVTIVLGLQPAFVTNLEQQILLEKVWFAREGNTLWWKVTIWAALFIIFILIIWRIFRKKEIS